MKKILKAVIGGSSFIYAIWGYFLLVDHFHWNGETEAVSFNLWLFFIGWVYFFIQLSMVVSLKMGNEKSAYMDLLLSGIPLVIVLGCWLMGHPFHWDAFTDWAIYSVPVFADLVLGFVIIRFFQLSSDFHTTV